MARPRDRHDPRRQDLIAMAERVFLAKGYAATTLTDLLSATGMSKGGFYHYFGTKDEVLQASMGEAIDDAVAVATAAAQTPGPPTDRLGAFFRGLRELRTRRRGQAQLLAVVLSDDAHAYAYYSQLTRQLAVPLAHVIQGLDVDHPAITAELLVQLMTTQARVSDLGGRAGKQLMTGDYGAALRQLIARTLAVPEDHPCLAELG